MNSIGHGTNQGARREKTVAQKPRPWRRRKRYTLTMDEIGVREQRCVHVEVRIGGQRRRPVDCCVTAIARFCDCKVWFSRDDAGINYVFFGFEADTASAAYLLGLINRVIWTELAIFWTRCQRFKGTGLGERHPLPNGEAKGQRRHVRRLSRCFPQLGQNLRQVGCSVLGLPRQPA